MLNMYSIYDRKSESYLSPNFSVSDGVLIRDFRVFLRKPGNMFAEFPEDYEIRKIGVFYTKEGVVQPCEPVPVMSFDEIMKLDLDNPESEDINGNA